MKIKKKNSNNFEKKISQLRQLEEYGMLAFVIQTFHYYIIFKEMRCAKFSNN